MNVHWVNNQSDLSGMAIGYSRAGRAMRGAFELAGGRCDDDAEVAVHFLWAAQYRPIPGRFNVLVTMFESHDVHPCILKAMDAADLVIVPTRWNAELFAPLSRTPVVTVPLGVDLDTFVGVDRPRPTGGRPFRWLWVGANNLRKGWQEVREAWCRGGFDTRADCELYLKTLGPRGMKSQVGRNTWVDDRLLTDAQLMLLYADADGFLFPSYGEGFGLTLLEAMATALPCIATLHTGMTEYADETVCRKVMTEPTTVCMDEAGYDTHYETVLRANVPDLVAQIAETMAHWTRAKRMGVRAWRRAQSFSWAAAGRRLVDVLATHSPADRRGGVSNAVSDPTGPDRCQVPAGR